MYQKQFITAPNAVNFQQTAVATNNYQINKTYYPNGTNQGYINQIAVKPVNGAAVGIQQPQPQQPGMTQKYYTIANGTYSNANGTVQTGIKTLNPTTGQVSYTVGNNQKYVISNPMTNTAVLNNRVQGVGQYSTVNNSMTNVYQVSNNNTVKVNGYIPNNGQQVIMNTINNGQMSYVKVNQTVNGNVISNPSNIVNYNGTNTALVNNGTASVNYLNKSALPNPNLMSGNMNFVKPINQNQNQMSPFLLTPPTTTTTSSRRRSDILRPPNPFILYRQEHHSKVLAEHEGISNTEISKIIGKMWKNESEEVKNKYKEKAQEMKRRHKLMYPDYRFAPRKQEEIRRRKKRKNITPPENAEKKDDASKNEKEEKKTEETKTEETTKETEVVENAKKKLKTEESTTTTTTTTTTTEINNEEDLLKGFNPEKNLIDDSLTKSTDETLLAATSSTSSLTNIPTTSDDTSSNIITSNSLFSLDSSLTNINSFDIENFDIAEDNSFIDNYLTYNSNHTFQTTSDSMFNQLTDLLNTTSSKK